MRSSTQLNITFAKDSRLEIRVPMDGSVHIFRKGTRGHIGRDYFEWNGKRWLLRFESFVEKLRRTDTTHDLLVEKVEKSEVGKADTQAAGPFASLWDKLRAAQDRKEAGWRLHKAANGVDAVFDLRCMRKLRTEKIGSFASFYVIIDGISFRGQFH